MHLFNIVAWVKTPNFTTIDGGNMNDIKIIFLQLQFTNTGFFFIKSNVLHRRIRKYMYRTLEVNIS